MNDCSMQCSGCIVATPPEEYKVEGNDVFALPFGPRSARSTVGDMPAAIGGRREPITKRLLWYI